MQIECVVFDLGGVLVELGGVRDFGDMIGEPDDARVWALWLSNRWVREYERGFCTTDAFARGLVEELELGHSAEEFIERFRIWPKGLIPGAYELVATLAASHRVACLSNTNELHWGRQADALRLAELFPTRFLSHEIGLIKPDREIYEHVVEVLGVAAESILFFDDNQLNVDAARDAGLRAERVQGPEPTRAHLEAYGLLSRSREAKSRGVSVRPAPRRTTAGRLREALPGRLARDAQGFADQRPAHLPPAQLVDPLAQQLVQ